ncbi:restriction endonuclease subunit S [Convivina intestini]|uniref:Type I restriction modification DNA specificity protein n=3 Tax=Convivina TaxID=1697027 RepID=A0A2U1D352_9LACO|nr:restriction endonuclease subunit S [Convivina intestini]PVY82088.1 type I restriction modification DNA specificity protein [Convivina intestini]SDC24904.1 Type I restriction modification DNA specificity domain-containing protein [Leuconostocaceae bacterium R-53105]
MIDPYDFQSLKLPDIAEYECAKAGHIYPAGTSTLQISATQGQIGFLKKPSEVEPKYVAIVPIAGVNPMYLNVVLQKNIQQFMHVFKAGINIQFDELANFKVQLHNVETQVAIAELFSNLDEKIEIGIQIDQQLKNQKQWMLSKMFI